MKANGKAGLATLRRALNGVIVSKVEASADRRDGIVLLLESDDIKRVTLWVDDVHHLRVDVNSNA